MVKKTHCCCHLCRSWSKPGGLEAASAAGGACGSRSHSAPLSVCAAWRCWWNSRWHKSQDTLQDILYWRWKQSGKDTVSVSKIHIWHTYSSDDQLASLILCKKTENISCWKGELNLNTSVQQKDETGWHARFSGLWYEVKPLCTRAESTGTPWIYKCLSLQKHTKASHVKGSLTDKCVGVTCARRSINPILTCVPYVIK